MRRRTSLFSFQHQSLYPNVVVTVARRDWGSKLSAFQLNLEGGQAYASEREERGEHLFLLNWPDGSDIDYLLPNVNELAPRPENFEEDKVGPGTELLLLPASLSS